MTKYILLALALSTTATASVSSMIATDGSNYSNMFDSTDPEELAYMTTAPNLSIPSFAVSKKVTPASLPRVDLDAEIGKDPMFQAANNDPILKPFAIAYRGLSSIPSIPAPSHGYGVLAPNATAQSLFTELLLRKTGRKIVTSDYFLMSKLIEYVITTDPTTVNDATYKSLLAALNVSTYSKESKTAYANHPTSLQDVSTHAATLLTVAIGEIEKVTSLTAQDKAFLSLLKQVQTKMYAKDLTTLEALFKKISVSPAFFRFQASKEMRLDDIYAFAVLYPITYSQLVKLDQDSAWGGNFNFTPAQLKKGAQIIAVGNLIDEAGAALDFLSTNPTV